MAGQFLRIWLTVVAALRVLSVVFGYLMPDLIRKKVFPTAFSEGEAQLTRLCTVPSLLLIWCYCTHSHGPCCADLRHMDPAIVHHHADVRIAHRLEAIVFDYDRFVRDRAFLLRRGVPSRDGNAADNPGSGYRRM
jgi:hypothetical protein